MEKEQFSYVLAKRTHHQFSDEHLWYSIFSRPPSTQFTRVQRCTCCFVLLFLAMFLNIMYYDLSQQAAMTNASLTFGPLRISSEEVRFLFLARSIRMSPSDRHWHHRGTVGLAPEFDSGSTVSPCSTSAANDLPVTSTGRSTSSIQHRTEKEGNIALVVSVPGLCSLFAPSRHLDLLHSGSGH